MRRSCLDSRALIGVAFQVLLHWLSSSLTGGSLTIAITQILRCRTARSRTFRRAPTELHHLLDCPWFAIPTVGFDVLAIYAVARSGPRLRSHGNPGTTSSLSRRMT